MTPTRGSGVRSLHRGLLVFVLLGAVSDLRGAPLFPNRSFLTGTGPLGLVVVDVNHDGLLDVVTANNGAGQPFESHTSTSSVSVLLAGPDGLPGAEVRFTEGRMIPLAPVAVVAADFDGDGNPDLALSNAPPTQAPPFFDWQSWGSVSVLLGRGDGTFGAQTHFRAGDGPGPIAAGDFNGDGVADLVVVNTGSDDVSMFLGLGDGRFAAQQRFATDASPAGLSVADFNGDGRIDLAVACASPGSISILAGRGDGTFGPRTSLPAEIQTAVVSAGDFDGDGIPDLASAGPVSRFIGVRRGTGDGNFESPQYFSGGPTATSIVVADLDDDGREDLIEVNQSPADLYVLPGRDDGGFGSVAAIVSLGQQRAAAVAGDVDRDGRTDLIAARSGSNDIVVAQGLGNGTFTPQPLVLKPLPVPGFIGANLQDVEAADLNGDGRPDLAVIDSLTKNVRVALAIGPGQFAAETRYSVGDGPTDPDALVLGDLTGDGWLDAVSGNSDNDDVSMLAGRGDGSFAPAVRLMAGDAPRDVAIADFDRDGHADLVAANFGSQDLSLFRGLGGGAIGPQLRIPLGVTPARLATGDFDGDDRTDLAVSTNASGRVIVLSAGLSGGLEVRTTTLVGSFVGALAAGDLDDDGRLDLVAGRRSVPGPRFQILRGRGDGGFDLLESYGQADQPFDLDLADLDGDGRLDIAATRIDGQVEIWRGAPESRFTGPERYAAGRTADALASADFNEDGKPDLAIAGRNDATWVLWNRSPDPNAPPIAVAGPDRTVECVGQEGVRVVLDGSGSTDPDSTPGTRDDIVSFVWFEDRGLPSEAALGEGERIEAILPLGVHRISVVVTDTAGIASADDMMIEVVDTTPPVLALALLPSTLWPPNHRMVEIEPAVDARDACGTAEIRLVQALSDEPDDAPGAGDGHTTQDIQGAEPGTPDFLFALRAERSASADGRVYSVTYSAIDASGNTAFATGEVAVPAAMAGAGDAPMLSVRTTELGSLLEWTPVPGAATYHVVRGDRDAVRLSGRCIDLGPLVGIAGSIRATSTAGFEDAAAPALGAAFFYLVGYEGQVSSGLGAAGAGYPAAVSTAEECQGP